MRIPQDTLNPAVVDPVGIPYIDTYGCHLSEYVTPLGLGGRGGSFSLSGCQPLDCCSGHPPVPLGQELGKRHGRLWVSHEPSGDVIQALGL